MVGTNLRPNHAMAVVHLLNHIFRLYRPGETRPSGVTVILVNRREQRFAPYDIHVNTRLFVVPIGVIKRRLRSAALRHLILLGSKVGYSFRIFLIFRHMLAWILFADRRGLWSAVPNYRAPKAVAISSC